MGVVDFSENFGRVFFVLVFFSSDCRHPGSFQADLTLIWLPVAVAGKQLHS